MVDEKALRDRDHRLAGAAGEYLVFERIGSATDHLLQRDRSFGDRRAWTAEKRSEAARAKFHPDHATAILQHAREAGGVDTEDARETALDHQMRVGVRQRLARLRRMAGQIPADEPDVLDDVGQRVARHNPHVLDGA